VRWAGVRRAALVDAAKRAGLNEVQLVEEPVAAAIHYASEHVELGAHVGVYDLGGGTFDTALLQRTDRGFEVVGVPGGDENIGAGTTIACSATSGRAAGATPSCGTDDDQRRPQVERARWTSGAGAVRRKRCRPIPPQVFVPVADRGIVVNHSQFRAMIIDDIEHRRPHGRHGHRRRDEVEDLAAIFLVGGSSRARWWRRW
jgi:molecular chaperone DnaK (HSP70)